MSRIQEISRKESMTTSNHEQNKRFPGFKKEYRRDFFKYPTVLESWWHSLSGAEQKCLDFILRNTYGYLKTRDKISISQFVSGIGERNKGAGVSKAQVPRALKALEEKGFIVVHRAKYRTNDISLVLEEAVEGEAEDVKVSLTTETERMIEMFRFVAHHRTDEFKEEKRQVRAIEKLIEHYGVDMVEQAISLVKVTNGKKYAPVIGSPVDLERKWASLVAYVQRQKDQEGPRISL